MANKNSNYKIIRSIEGIEFHLYEHSPNRWTPHSYSGPAVIYPKGINKPDEYHIYGIPYTYDKWLELSRIPRKTKNKEDFAE